VDVVRICTEKRDRDGCVAQLHESTWKTGRKPNQGIRGRVAKEGGAVVPGGGERVTDLSPRKRLDPFQTLHGVLILMAAVLGIFLVILETVMLHVPVPYARNTPSGCGRRGDCRKGWLSLHRRGEED